VNVLARLFNKVFNKVFINYLAVSVIVDVCLCQDAIFFYRNLVYIEFAYN